jgi:hypothetical protein
MCAVALHLLDQEQEVTVDDDKITSGILGLGGAPVPKAPGDPSAADDERSVARRRARIRMAEEEEAERAEESEHRHAGATGIDMGAGGEGTDIETK